MLLTKENEPFRRGSPQPYSGFLVFQGQLDRFSGEALVSNANKSERRRIETNDFWWFLEYNQAASSLIQDTQQLLIQNHL